MRIPVLSRLARPMLRLLGRDESGAVGALVAILLGGGVLVGMGAMVVDVGQLYQKRAELQNGADAGALAVAKSCLTSSCNSSVAGSFANQNSASGVAGVDLVCGSGSLGACPAPTGALTDCPAPPAGATNYVDVHTESLTKSGSTLVPPVFAKTLLGNGNYNGTTVYACAQAIWGAPKTATSGLAFTISACEWYQDTVNGTVFAPPPPAVPSVSVDEVLQFHGESHDGCKQDNASGSDGPGMFGWTDDSGNCQLVINGSTYADTPGTSASNDCKVALANDAVQGAPPVLIPIYSSETGNGANGSYTLLGFASFVVTGYSVPGASSPDWLDKSDSYHGCGGDVKGIFGYFVQGLIPSDSSGTIGGTNLGAQFIKLTG